MSNTSTAKILSRSQLYEAVFGAHLPNLRPFVFYAGTRVDADRKPIYDQCVIGHGETEQQARANAEAILYGKLGHNGYHLGELIPLV